jgi:nucleoid-associated protein YgaU
MGQHSKTSGSRLAVLFGAVAALPLTQGTALADSHPSIDWSPIIQCESGGNPQAHNPRTSASGLFQFMAGTWRSLGGLAFGRTAADATPREQERIADRAYASEGLGPWEASRDCWSGRAVRRSVHVYARRTTHHLFRRTRVERVVTYTVRAGDTLSSIAAARGYSWEQLWSQNRAAVRNPNRVYPGLTISL